MDNNQFSVLLSGMIDEIKSVSNINNQIKNIQKSLKEVNISLNLGNVDKQLNSLMDKVNKTVSTGNKNPMSAYQKALEDTIHKYKTGLLDLETYSKRMQSIMFGNNSTYKNDFTKLSDKSQERYVAELNKAYQLQGKALDEVYKITKKIQSEDDKRLKAINDQKIAIQKMQSAFDSTNSKYSFGVDQDKSNGIQVQIDALAKLNPQSAEYGRILKETQMAVGLYNKELIATTTSENKQSKAITDKTLAISKLKDQLDNMKTNYGSYVDSGKSNEITKMIGDLEKLNPLSVEYGNKLKTIQYETNKLGNQSKQSFKVAQDAISDTTAKTSSMGLALRQVMAVFAVGSPIFMARNVFVDMTSSINEMNKAMTDIRIVTDMSAESAQGLNKTYNQLAKQMGATTSDVLSGSTEWFRQGKTIAETQELVKSSIIGSKLAGIEAADMTQYLTSALNGYKLEADKAISVIDKLIAVDNAAATSVSELAIAMSYTASSARMAGVSMDDLIGYIGTVSSVTRKSAESIGTSFRSMFARFQNIKLGKFVEDGMAMSDVRKALANIKIDIMETEDTFRDFSVVIDELSGKWDTLSDVEKSSVANAMAGMRQREDFIVLLDNMSMSADLATKSIESQGLAMERYDIYLESTEATLNRFKASAEALYIETLGSETINGIINLGTALLDMTTKTGGLGTVLNAAALSFVALKASSLFLVEDEVIVGMSSITKSLLTLKGATDTTTVSTLALSTAQKLLIGGAIVAGVMAIGAGLKYMSESAERAQQKVSDLKSELETLNSNTKSVADLSSQYQELSNLEKQQGLTNEEQEKFIRIQNELKELLPEVNGYYNSQGNFIINETLATEDLVRIQREYVEEKRKELALASQLSGKNTAKKYENEAEKLNRLTEYQELYNKSITTGLTQDEGDRFSYLKNNYADLSRDIKSIEDDIVAMGDTHKSTVEAMKNEVIDIVATTQEWTNLTEEQEDAVRKYISTLDGNALKPWHDGLVSGSKSASEFVKELLKFPEVQNEIKMATESVNESIGNQAKRFSHTAEELSELTKSFKESTSNLQSLNGALQELDKNHSLSSNTITSLIDKYPDLLKYLDDETGMRQYLTEKISEEEKVHKRVLFNKLQYDTEYYNEKIRGNEHLVNEIKKLYGVDLKNFNSLAEAKAAVEEKLINALGSAWARMYANNLAKFESQMSILDSRIQKGDIQSEKLMMQAHAAKTAVDTIRKASKFEEVVVDFVAPSAVKLGDPKAKKDSSSKSNLPKYITQGFDDAMKEIESKGDQLERIIDRTNKKILNAQKLGNIQEELELQKQLEEMYEKRITLQEEQSVAFLNLRSKLVKDLSSKKLNELKGINLESITEKQLADVSRKLDAEIDKANQAKKDKLANDLSNRKSMINEYASAIMDANKNINNLATSWWDSENERIEQSIALIERKYELENKLIDNRIRQLDVEMMLAKDDSAEYLELEKLKYDESLNKQNNYLKQIKEIKEKGLEVDAEVIEKYKDMWYDAERERINMLKSMGERAKKLKLDSLNLEQENLTNAQKATQSLVDMVIKMLKQQYDEEKKLIQENMRLKEEANKKEKDGYREIIEARKRALRDEKESKSYDKELKEKQKKVSDVDNKILALANDNSKKAQAERLRLEEEKLKYIDELNEFQENRSIELQEKALDDELKRYEDMKNDELDRYKKQKDAELKKLEEHLSKEGNLRAEAIRLIENKNRDLYDKLIEWNKEYGDSLDSTVKDTWYDAYDAMDEYNNGQLNVLNTLGRIADKLKEVKADIKDVGNSSWQDYVDRDDITPEKSRIPVYDDKPKSSSSSDSSSSGTKKYTEAQAKNVIQTTQARYLREEEKKAREQNNTGLIKWIQAERKRWGINPTSGDITTYGIVPSEIWEREKKKYGFLKGGETRRTGLHWLDGSQTLPERVLSPEQTQTFNKMVEYLPSVVSKIESFEKTENGKANSDIVFHIDKMVNVEGNLDDGFDMKKMKDEVINTMNQVLANIGIKPKGIRLSNGRI